MIKHWDAGLILFELVRDPWLPWVYAGIFLMLAGAVGLFIIPKNNRKQ